VQGDPGLHIDQGQVVADGVVELAGDAQPFLTGPPAGFFLPDPGRLGFPLPPDADDLGRAEEQQDPRRQAGQERSRGGRRVPGQLIEPG
jgi:hypothetical protein